MAGETTDVIVVGAGSSGCMVTRELVARFGCRVTLIESPSAAAPVIDRLRPARWLKLLGSAEDYQRRTASCPGLAGRRLAWPRGRGLGGSSRINAMIWFAPTPADFAALAGAGGAAWSRQPLEHALQRGLAQVQPEAPRWLSESATRFLAACEGIPHIQPLTFQRCNRNGSRWTAAELITGLDAASLRTVRGTVQRLVWQGDTVTGVEIVTPSTQEIIRSRCGVVLCAGAVESPAILLRSGIGPGETLLDAGLPIRVDLPAVGQNLQDHLIMPVIASVPGVPAFPLDASPRDLARWQLLGRGPLASNIAECGALADSDRLQFHVTPTHYLAYPARQAPPAMTIGVNVTQPKSRGMITIESAEPGIPPIIQPSYLNAADDLEQLIAGVRLAREIFQSPHLASWKHQELIPGSRRNDTASLARSIARYAQTLYHPVGTCAMGPPGERAVVGQGLQVRGTRQLWILDASMLPVLTIGNPTATIIAAAVLGAELIYGQMT